MFLKKQEIPLVRIKVNLHNLKQVSIKIVLLEKGVLEEFEQKYDYPFEMKNSQNQWFKEYYDLIQNLHLVNKKNQQKVDSSQ